MRRVAVIGCGGSGKSTLSNKLSDLTGLPVYHLDTIFWKAGWKEEDTEVFLKKQQEWVDQDQWIIDGNMTDSIVMRLQKADTIIFLDYPTWLSVYGVLKRLISDFGKTRSDMAEGCAESFHWPFLKYVLGWRRNTRPNIQTALKNYAQNYNIISFRNSKEMRSWIMGIPAKAGIQKPSQ